MPGLTKPALSGCQIDNAINHGEIAHDLHLITTKAAVQDPHHLRGRRHLVITGKEETLHRPAVQKLAGNGERHHRRADPMTGHVYAVKSQMIIQREHVKDIAGNPGRRQEDPVRKIIAIAQPVRRKNRLLNARRHLKVLLNLAQGLAQARVTRGKRGFKREHPGPRVQSRPQFPLFHRLAEKIIRPGIKPERQIPRIFTGSQQYDVNIVAKLAAADLPA